MNAKGYLVPMVVEADGNVTAGLAIYDTMRFLKCPVATYCVGQAASMGAILLSAEEAKAWGIIDQVMVNR